MTIPTHLEPGTAPGGFTFRLHDRDGVLVLEQPIPAALADEVPEQAEAAALRAMVLDGYQLLVYDGDDGKLVARIRGSR